MVNFKGDNFDKDPLTDHEVARVRQMLYHVDGLFPQLESVAGVWPDWFPTLKAIVGIMQAGKSLAITFAVVGVLAGAVTWGVNQEFFQ